MRKKGYKGRTERRTISKAKGVIKIFDAIQSAYVDELDRDESIAEVRCNVLLDGLEVGEYTTDIVCVRDNGDMMVRECVSRKHLTKPLTIRLLDISKEYWSRHGVDDWGIVIDGKE